MHEKDSWAKVAAINTANTQRTTRANITTTPPERQLSRELEIVAWIKGDLEVERVQKMSAAEVIALAQGPNNGDTLPARKNILGIRRFKGMIIFRVDSETTRKTLESSDHWVKDVSKTATLRQERAGVLVHGVRVRGMPTDMTKGPKVIEEASAKIHPGLKVDKTEWLTRDFDKKDYSSLIVWVTSAEVANRLIQWGITIESDIKTVQYYDRECRMKQCLKCQEYGHLTYACKNDQRCAHCAQDHRTETCPNTKKEDHWKCGACKGKHRAFDPRCPKRQTEKQRIKNAERVRPVLHAVRAKTTGKSTTNFTLGSIPTPPIVLEKAGKRKVPPTSGPGRPSTASKFQNAPIAPGDSVATRLLKKNRSNDSIGSQTTLTSQDGKSDDMDTTQDSSSIRETEQILTQSSFTSEEL